MSAVYAFRLAFCIAAFSIFLNIAMQILPEQLIADAVKILKCFFGGGNDCV